MTDKPDRSGYGDTPDIFPYFAICTIATFVQHHKGVKDGTQKF
jgi:hypothetical protein